MLTDDERDPSPDVRWIETIQPETTKSRFALLATAGAVGNRADVTKVGLSDQGITFVKSASTKFVEWERLESSKMQLGKGFLVLKADDGPSGGTWTVDPQQARAVLTHPHWRFPDFTKRVMPKWFP